MTEDKTMEILDDLLGAAGECVTACSAHVAYLLEGQPKNSILLTIERELKALRERYKRAIDWRIDAWRAAGGDRPTTNEDAIRADLRRMQADLVSTLGGFRATTLLGGEIGAGLRGAGAYGEED